MKNMKYAYASLMAIISIILLLSNESIKITFEKAFAFSEDAITVTGGVVQISANNQNTCALTSSGGVKCWGWNMQGQLGGVGAAEANSLPTDVVGITANIKYVDVGNDHSCGITSTGGVKCWGNNSEWERGGPNIAPYHIPADISTLDGVMSISAGSDFSCALTNSGGVKCWGGNTQGQLGNGTISSTGSVSVAVGLSSGVIAIATGWEHSCALTNSGGVKCWGSNDQGQLGNNSTTDSSTPVDVVGLGSGVTDISSGFLHTCAVMNNGATKCWGYNHAGQLGNSGTTNQTIPVDVLSITGALEIKTGYNFSCVRLSSGVKCWGNNSNGQLGNGSTGSSLSPVNVSGISSESLSLSLGAYHACVIQNNGGAKCWGDNSYGQLGDGTLSGRTSPVSILDSSGTQPLILFSTGTTNPPPSSQSGVTIGNLHWEKVTENLQAYEYYTGAIQYCSGLAPVGKWRIPSNSDFSSGITTLGSTGAFNDAIELTGNTKVWSSTPQTGDPSRSGQALYSTGGIGFWYSFTDQPGWAQRLICVVNISDWSGSLVNGACTGLPSNGVYYNSGTSYTLINAASGTSLTASYNANPAINTCQFKCGTGATWNGASCTLSGTGISSSPTIVSPTGTINTTTPIYSGSGGSGAIRVEVRTVGGTLIASGASTLTGYSLAPVLALSEGLSTFLVTGYDSLGMSGTTVTGSVTVDSIAPANPIILSHASGTIIPSQSFTLTGTAETGSTVRVTISTGNVYSGFASSTGAWSMLVNFPVGTSYPTFTAVDNAGNTSTGITLTLITTNSGDTTAPAAPIITSHVTGMSVSGSVTLSGTAEAWSMVSIYNSGTLIASAQASSSGVWSNIINLITGQNTLTLYATDGAGNRSIATGIALYSMGGSSFSGITITSPLDGSSYSYSNIIATGSGTPGNTIIVATPAGNISSLIGTNGTWSVQINLTTGSNLLTFYERNPNGVLTLGINRTVTYTVGGTDPGYPENPSTTTSTPIGSYIPSKNDPSIQDHDRLEQLPSDRMCALDEHVKLNRIVTSDIKGNWAEGYIRTLIRFWVIKNTENFYPSKSISRGEFLALTIRSLRCNYEVEELDYAVTSSFEDVPEDHWVNKYLAIAEQYGWLPSDLDSRFRPDHFITRSEAMDIVAGATGLYDSEGADEFVDIMYLSEVIQEAILTAQKYDIVHGIRKFTSWYFYPDNLLTRAEAAKIIQRTFVR